METIKQGAVKNGKGNKVLFLANTGWYLNNFRRSTILAFLQHNYEVSVLCPKGTGEDLLLDLDIDIETFQLDLAGTNIFVELISFHSLFLMIRKNRPDMVFSFNPKTNLYGSVVCRLTKIPHIPNISGVGNASQLTGWKGPLYRLLSRVAFKRSAKIFFQNSNDQKTFEDSGILESVPHETLPGSGVDIERFHPEFHKKSHTVRFLLACRLIRQKGVMEYLKSAEILKAKYGSKVEFLLAGVPDLSDRGVPEKDILAFANQGVIEYLGNVHDVSKVLMEVDCTVLPSNYPEGTPRFLLEGAAAGKVLITTNRPGCREVVVLGQNGFFCEPNSVESLADVLEQVLLLQPNEMKRMGECSREHAVTNFDERKVINSYIDAAEMISGNPGKKR